MGFSDGLLALGLVLVLALFSAFPVGDDGATAISVWLDEHVADSNPLLGGTPSGETTTDDVPWWERLFSWFNLNSILIGM